MSTAPSPRHLAFVGLDTARFLGWLPGHEEAVLVVRDAMGLTLPQPVLECPAGEEDGGTLALLQHPAVLPFLRTHGVSTIVVFKPSFRVQQWVEAQGFTLLAGDCGLAQRLENKIQFAQMAASDGVPIPPFEVFRKGLPPWEEISSRFQVPLVLQKARGHSGQGTFLIEGQEAWEHHVHASRGRGLWKVSQVISGDTWTFNGVLTETGNTIVGGLYQQRTGDPRCTASPLGACGNLWSLDESDPRLDGAVQACILLLRTQRYTGAFGVDLLLPEDGSPALVIEVNARSTSGLSMEAMLSRHLGETPLVDYLTGREHADAPVMNLSGSTRAIQAVMYGSNSEPNQVSDSLQSGTWHWPVGATEPDFAHKGTDPTACHEHEAVILARSVGQWVGAQGERARIQSMGNEESLGPWIEWVSGHIRA